MFGEIQIDQCRYNKIHPETIDLSTRLWEINTEFVGFIPCNSRELQRRRYSVELYLLFNGTTTWRELVCIQKTARHDGPHAANATGSAYEAHIITFPRASS